MQGLQTVLSRSSDHLLPEAAAGPGDKTTTSRLVHKHVLALAQAFTYEQGGEGDLGVPKKEA